MLLIYYFLSTMSFCHFSEFHYGPDEAKENNEITHNHNQGEQKKPTHPPESTFKKLAPSEKRYTLLTRDEL